MKKDFKTTAKPIKYLQVDVAPGYYKHTIWNRFKTRAWNFILPPHIKLSIKDSTQESEEGK